VIDDSAELAAGVRPSEAVLRSLCDHSGLTRRQLDYIAQAEGLPTAIELAVWRGTTAQPRPADGRTSTPPSRLIRKHAVIELLAASNPPVGGSDMSPTTPGKAWSTRGTPFAHCDSTSAAGTTTMRPARP